MMKVREIIQPHMLHILVIILVILAVMQEFASTDFAGGGDTLTQYYPQYLLMRENLLQQGSLALWNPYAWGGHPFASITVKAVFYLPYYLFLLIPKAAPALNASIIVHLMLAGIAMYFLALQFLKDKNAALISALVYALNGHIISRVYLGAFNYIYGYPWIPLVILFFYRALDGKNWLKNSIYAGVSFSMIFLAGAVPYFVYTALFLLLYFIYAENLAIERNRETRLRLLSVAIILCLVAVGLIAVKFLPANDFLGHTNRYAAFEREYAFDPDEGLSTVTFDNMLYRLVFLGSPGNESQAHLGVVSIILIAIGLNSYRREVIVKFFGFIMLVSLLAALGTLVYDILYSFFPVVNSIRYASRILILFALAGSILSGYGFKAVSNNLAMKRKNPGKKIWIPSLIVILIILELGFLSFQQPVMFNLDETVNNNNILKEVSARKGTEYYRVHSLQSTGIDSSMTGYSMPLGLETLYGFDGSLWMLEYLNEYLHTSWGNPPRFWGILNARYIISKNAINEPDFTLLGRYDSCSTCSHISYGPYLYQNNLARPRAFNPRNTILVLGHENYTRTITYNMLLDRRFSVMDASVVTGREPVIVDNGLGFLKNFDLVIATYGSSELFSGSVFVKPSLRERIRGYEDSGGVFLPKLLEGDIIVNGTPIMDVVSGLSQNPGVVSIESYTPNRVVVNVEDAEGILVMSEKYYMFPDDWKAVTDTGISLTLYRADGMATAVVIPDGSGKIVFSYFPESLKTGLLVTMATLMIVAFIIVYPDKITDYLEKK